MNKHSQRNYIIYAPPFDENVGGIIFLHQLVHELNEMGERAFVWPFHADEKKDGLHGRLKRLRASILGPKKRPFNVSTELNTPIAQPSDLTAFSIVVYPELVLGNPLNAKNVVRWLLYEPGVLHPYKFGTDEMFFRVGEMFDLQRVTGGAPDLFLYKVNSRYRDENRSNRNGVCYIVRKGAHKPRIPQTEVPGAIQIDNKSHAEINEIFNCCHTFYSYDEATMYSQYAAICGCTSVVIPGHFDSREEWVRNYELARYGVAYGLDDIPHAIATRGKVRGLLEDRETAGRKTVENFIRLTSARF